MSVIVVGIDGSPAADAALAHALEEAKLRHLPLRIVCAWEIPAIEYAGAPFVATPDLSTEAEHSADTVLAAATEKIGSHPGVELETLAVHGHPANVLIEQAQGAALLVVGTRGRKTLTSLVLGSVSQAVAHHCPIPLTIVPCPQPANGSASGSESS
jgi:nucleotide-binding universal stress UspA family protein